MARGRQLVLWPLLAAALGVATAMLASGAALLFLQVIPESDEPWGDLGRIFLSILFAVIAGVVVWVVDWPAPRVASSPPAGAWFAPGRTERHLPAVGPRARNSAVAALAQSPPDGGHPRRSRKPNGYRTRSWGTSCLQLRLDDVRMGEPLPAGLQTC